MKNPFITNGYFGAKYFCDRQKETLSLKRLIEGGNNVAIISHRRIGKTGLVMHLFAQDDIRDSYSSF